MQITQQANDLIQPFKQGKVFAYPTEAVYGLGCDPDNQSAVMRLLEIKKRSPAKGLILIASNFSQVEKYLKPLSESQQQFTQASDTTYIFPALKSAPVWLTGDFDSLAIRITKHPLAKALCETLGSAVVSTSANISAQQAAKTVEELTTQLGDKIDYLLEGE
jgi:L-threonylcarbamoyladenylate synthase